MPNAAEKTPIVPMNSFTGMPLRTWTFLNTCSDKGGGAGGAAWPLTNTTLDSHTAADATTPGIDRFSSLVIVAHRFP